MDKRKLGKQKEDMAASFLINNGYKIIERNYSCRRGEIDIISLKGKYICFTEVKYRKNDLSGAPEEAVTAAKMIKICKCANYYMYTHQKYDSYQMRFDVIAILNEDLKIYENAFDYITDSAY